MNARYTNWCRMPSPEEIAREADAAAQKIADAAAAAFDVEQRIVYNDHGEQAPGVVLAVEHDDIGPRYKVRVTSRGFAWTLWCSGADLEVAQ